MRSWPSPCWAERTVSWPSSVTSMLMSSGATPGIGVTTISSRSFSKRLMGTAVASVMSAPPAGPMLPRPGADLALAAQSIHEAHRMSASRFDVEVTDHRGPLERPHVNGQSAATGCSIVVRMGSSGR